VTPDSARKRLAEGRAVPPPPARRQILFVAMRDHDLGVRPEATGHAVDELGAVGLEQSDEVRPRRGHCLARTRADGDRLPALRHPPVVLQREVLRPKLHARLHDLVLGLERGHEPPVERKRPQDRQHQRGRGDDRADEIKMEHTGEPARSRRDD